MTKVAPVAVKTIALKNDPAATLNRITQSRFNIATSMNGPGRCRPRPRQCSNWLEYVQALPSFLVEHVLGVFQEERWQQISKVARLN
jgi:hypothetical protein